MRDIVTDTPYGRTYGAATGRRRLEQWYTRPPAQRRVDWSALNAVTRVAWDRREPRPARPHGRRLPGPLRASARRDHTAAEALPASAKERVWTAAVGVVAWGLRDWSSYQRLGRVVEATAPRPPSRG